MTEQPFDERGEAHEALGTIVSSYGGRVLGSPQMLRNLVADLLPDLPRERSLLVSAAEASVAAQMTQYVEEHHIDAETAVHLVARSLSERTMIDSTASMWVTTEFAQALGYPARTHRQPAPDPVPAGALGALDLAPTAFSPPGMPFPQHAATTTASQFEDTAARYQETITASPSAGTGPVSAWPGSGSLPADATPYWQACPTAGGTPYQLAAPAGGTPYQPAGPAGGGPH
ncbi:MAG: hypothetical protein ACRDNZ_09350, partial [Streptosporangiaceae bacterium]